MAEISIIVPIYNVSQYLHQCIDSIINQTFSDIEVILVDDGSTDGSGSICDEYAGRDSRIKVIHKENGGPVSARKAALMSATSPYVGCVDSDDWIEPDMYEKLYRKMKEYNADVVMCGWYEDTGENRRGKYHGFEDGFYDKSAMIRDIYPNMISNGKFFGWGVFPALWDKLFRREYLEEFQMNVDERLRICEDLVCVFPCLLHVQSIYIMRECLYHYRQSLSSLVHRKGERETERFRYSLLHSCVMEKLGEYGDEYNIRSQWMEYILFQMMIRADILYDGIEWLDYLFPFPEVKRGMTIVLYGMGVFGQSMYRLIKEHEFCNIALVADQNYRDLRKQGLDVHSSDEIGSCSFDCIVITNSFYKVRKSICQDLARKYPYAKLCTLDEQLLKSEETMKRFRLV